MAEGFDFTNPEQYTLSIRLCTDGFSFSAYNPSAEHPFYYQPYKTDRSHSMAVNVRAMLRQAELSLPYRQVRIYMAQANYMPVPFDLFDEEAVEPLFHYNFTERRDGKMLLHNILPKANVAMIYSVEKPVYQLLKEQYPDARFYTVASPLTEYFTTKSYLGNSKKLYVYLQSGTLTVFAFDRGRLLLLNTFPCKHTGDCIYYLLYIWQQLDFNRNRDELHIVGHFPEKGSLVEKLREYLRQVYVINPIAEFHRAAFSKTEEIPFDLQASLLCDI